MAGDCEEYVEGFLRNWALECNALIILFWDLLLKWNHYEMKVYTFFSLVTSKPRESC